MAESEKGKPSLLESLPADLRRRIGAAKAGVLNLSKQFDVVREKARERAPVILALYKAVDHAAGDIKVGIADFARLFDGSVPTHAAEKNGIKGYRAHPVYYSINYMLGLKAREDRPKSAQGKRDPAVDQLARTIRFGLQFVVPEDHAIIFKAFAQVFGMDARTIKRLEARVQSTKPILDLTGRVKPVHVTEDRIVLMERTKPTTDEGGDAMPGLRQAARAVGVADLAPGRELAAPGRRVRRAA